MTIAFGMTALGAAAQTSGSSTTVLARINGEPITERELDMLIAQQTQGQTDLPPMQRRQFLQETINLMLLAQAGRDRDLDEDLDLRARFNNSERTALAQAFVRELTTREPVDEAEVRERYEAEYGGEPSREYRARHILVAEQDQAQALNERIRQGDDFAELAKQFSQDGSAQQGGDLGWFAPGDMVAPFASAVKQLNAGELTAEPIETRFGWHVIRVDDVREGSTPAFEEVAGQIRMGLVNRRIQQELEALRDDARIRYQADWAQPDES